MIATGERAHDPSCAGCGMHFTPAGRALTARAPGSMLDVPVCSRACRDLVVGFGTAPGWHP